VHSPVFRRIRRSDNDSRVEELCIPDSHAGLNAALFGFNGRRNHAPIGAVVGGNDKRFAMEEGIGLLFHGGKAEIRVNMHDAWLVAVNG
jgi:hypothetical protein